MMSRYWVQTLGAIVTVVALLTATHPAQAAFTIYTDRATFNAATTTTTIDFEENASGSGTYYNDPGFTSGGANFRGIRDGFKPDYLQTFDPDVFAPHYNWNSGDVLVGPTGIGGSEPGRIGRIQVTLTPGFTAVGVDLMTILEYAGIIDIAVSTGHSTSITTLDYPNRQFLGFTSDVAITSISYRSRVGYILMDNFSYGSANDFNPTPAPAGIVLFGLGFAGLGMLRSFRKGKNS